MSLTNLERARLSLTYLLECGVTEVVTCAGARNAPLVELLMAVAADFSDDKLKCWSFFEERSAAFFALGRCVRRGTPIAVLTTSGTAAAELLPAVIEANYQGRPLIVVTADRPSRFRGSGSPQSMEQVGLYGNYVETCFDLEDDFATLTKAWSGERPLHLNVCFEEPQSQRPTPLETMTAVNGLRSVSSRARVDQAAGDARPAWPAAMRQPLVIVGPLRPEDRAAALEVVRRLPGPVYAEALSGLTGEATLMDRMIRGEEIAGLALDGTAANGGLPFCDGVIRLGTVPTCRVWRDLEVKRREVPVVNLVPANARWSGLARKEHVFAFPLNALPEMPAAQGLDPRGQALVELSKNAAGEFEKLVADFPKSEMALVRALALRAAHPAHLQRVYLGNSLTVREWDAVSPHHRFADVYGHRGVNGIDGQVSSFLAWSAADAKTGDLAVVGDLTAMYDLAALGFTTQLEPAKRTLAVINNGGGMIFKRIFPHDLFLNRHETSFGDWAKMFKWSYHLAHRPEDLRFAQSPENLILEIRPDAGETAAFQTRWAEWLRRETGA